MKRIWLVLQFCALLGPLIVTAAIVHAAPANSNLSARSTSSFDADWRFLQSDASGAQALDFDDKEWRVVNVPHDWSIEGTFDQKSPTGGAGGWLPAGVGWYRKRFALADSDAHRRVFLEFDGVMANSEVWINGISLGKRPYGYVSFRYELTGHVRFGASNTNVVAVRADNSAQPASRWYTGAGIYRHVRLIVTDPVHLEQWATFVSTPKVAAREATVKVETAVVNQSSVARTVSIEVAIYAPGGTIVKTSATAARTVQAGQSATFVEALTVTSPVVWDLDRPALYRAVARVRDGQTTLDDEPVAFGIREFHFDAATGFWLNGKNFKLKGVCLHEDGGALGSAIPLAVWEQRLTVLRSLGVNAIRTAHHPPAPEFLDLCDRMGFLVMDEMFDCWTVAKKPFDYHLYFREWSKLDTRDTVRRDRNHPSIVLYSAGNEIHDTPRAELAKEILSGLLETFHRNDPTRPVTQALFRPNASHDYEDGLADMLDVAGQNYRENEILAAHAAKPSRKILGTENHYEVEAWRMLRDNPPYAGQFLWVGVDYLGESRGWPVTTGADGLLDRTGGVKPSGYERQSWWSAQPMVYVARRVPPAPGPAVIAGYEPVARRAARTLFADWTPANPAAHDENVEVFSNCEEVELYLNGRSLGVKPIHADATPRTWQVAYEAGVLRAVGRNQGRDAAVHELRTAGAAAKIVLSTNRGKLAPEWDDVVYITATVVDRIGVPVPGAGIPISFELGGDGSLIAVDSGDVTSLEPFHATVRKTFDGHCTAIIRATAGSGGISVKATAPSLEDGVLRIAAARER
jgi:beta-galactosidase